MHELPSTLCCAEADSRLQTREFRSSVEGVACTSLTNSPPSQRESTPPSLEILENLKRDFEVLRVQCVISFIMNGGQSFVDLRDIPRHKPFLVSLSCTRNGNAIFE